MDVDGTNTWTFENYKLAAVGTSWVGFRHAEARSAVVIQSVFLDRFAGREQ
jgi:hypothetical protein